MKSVWVCSVETVVLWWVIHQIILVSKPLRNQEMNYNKSIGWNDLQLFNSDKGSVYNILPSEKYL